jgi:hypothetical protein
MSEQSSGLEDAAASTKPVELSNCSKAFDGQNSTKSAQKKQAIAALRRDFAAEALRVVALKASHAADDIALGDDVGAERGISIVIAHVKEAAAVFRELQRGASG